MIRIAIPYGVLIAPDARLAVVPADMILASGTSPRSRISAQLVKLHQAPDILDALAAIDIRYPDVWQLHSQRDLRSAGGGCAWRDRRSPHLV